MKKIIISASVLAALFLNPSCKPKEVVGPAGPAGATGTPGTDGTNGKDGKDGNANVIGTSVYISSPSDWVLTSSLNLYTSNIPIPQITAEIVNNGSVLVYQKDGSSWIPLNYTLGKNITSYSFRTGNVRIINYNTDFSANPNPSVVAFRIDIIAAN